MAQLMPLPLNVSCFSKIQIGFTFLVPAHLGCPRQRAVEWLCVCVCVCYDFVNNITFAHNGQGKAMRKSVVCSSTRSKV